MQKPDLDQMWESFIKMNLEDVKLLRHIKIIRSKIYPMIFRLKGAGIINWYCFLIHDRKSGVPTSQDDDNPYFHIRFGLKGTNPSDFLNSLPDYYVMTRKIPRESIESISGVDKLILKNEEIEEAWRIIGEASEWIMNMLNIYREDIEIPVDQIVQFLHYYANMTQIQIK